MATKIEILTTEITGDPLTRGYAGMSDQAVADDLNTVYRSQNRTSMTASEVYNAVNAGEWAALSAADKEEVWNVVHLGTINPFGREATVFTSIFGGGSTTIGALAAARVESVSRGTELGVGVVGEGDIWDVRNG